MIQRHEPFASADPELWSCVEAVVEGTLTAEQRDRLDERLRRDPAARCFYAAYLDLHAQLQWRTRGRSVAGVGPTAPPEATVREQQALAHGSRSTPRPRWRRLFASAAGLAVAASLFWVIGLTVAMLFRQTGSDEAGSPELSEPPAGSVAVLIDDSHNTLWENDMALPTATGSALPPGRLKLKAGIVEIAFLGGAAVLLEGPADFDLRTSDRASLRRGRLTAKVPAGAVALKLDMPGVVVTDRVGECGVVRDEFGRTEVHLFEGEGDVGAGSIDGKRDALPWTRLVENTGAQVDAVQQTLLPLPLNEQAFAHLRPEIRVIDAAVRGGQFADRNFGTASRLIVKNSIPDFCWETYLRFDLSGVKGNIGEARVRLVPVQVGQPVENAVAVVEDNQWGETAITWDNKPSSGPSFATWIAEADKSVEFDVTPLVQKALASDKKLSLRIFAPHRKRGNSDVQYGSREGELATRPQLILTTAP